MFFVALFAACRSLPPEPAPVPGRSVFFAFDKYTEGMAPGSFESGMTTEGIADADARPLANGINNAHKPGHWVVVSSRDARSGDKLLAQTDATNTAGRVPITWVRDARFGSGIVVSVEARSRELDGLVDLGVAWCVHDANEYLVLRADGGTDELKLLAVRRGKATLIASAKQHFAAHQWFTLTVEQDGSRVRAGVDQKLLIDANVPSDFRYGTVGLCTFEGVTAEFDNFSVVGSEMNKK